MSALYKTTGLAEVILPLGLTRNDVPEVPREQVGTFVRESPERCRSGLAQSHEREQVLASLCPDTGRGASQLFDGGISHASQTAEQGSDLRGHLGVRVQSRGQTFGCPNHEALIFDRRS